MTGKIKGFYTKNGKKRPITSRVPHAGTYQKGVAHLGVPKRLTPSSARATTYDEKSVLSDAWFKAKLSTEKTTEGTH